MRSSKRINRAQNMLRRLQIIHSVVYYAKTKHSIDSSSPYEKETCSIFFVRVICARVPHVSVESLAEESFKRTSNPRT